MSNDKILLTRIKIGLIKASIKIEIENTSVCKWQIPKLRVCEVDDFVLELAIVLLLRKSKGTPGRFQFYFLL